MNIVKMFHMMPLFLVGLAFASVSVFILYTAVQGGDPDFYCVGICFGIPFGLAGLAMLSGAIQGIRTEVETYVVLEQHVEYGTDPLNNAQSGTWFPSQAAVQASRPDDPSSTGATDDSEVSSSATPSDEAAKASNLEPAKDADEAGGVFWDTKPVDED